MNDADERLTQDVAVLAAMAEHMPDYLDSDTLYWPAPRGGMSMLTLGGYLLREHRLLALANRLAPEQQAQVSAAIAQFSRALDERIVRFEKKARAELDARLRQWEESLKEMEDGTFNRTSNYGNAVETRAILQALVDRLNLPPYEADTRAEQRLALLDTRLRNNFRPGDFVWPEEWAPAYPQPAYWWLYGAPREKKKAAGG